jgi:hypothetical protein
MNLQERLNEHVLDPKNTYKMFELAREYDRLEQGAAAVSFYIRCADLENDDKELQYKCMIYTALAYDRQRGRNYTVTGLFQHAISILPNRPEAHYYLAKHGENMQDWRMCLNHALLGLEFKDAPDIDVDWPGEKELWYMRALGTWQISGVEHGRQMLFDLIYRRKFKAEKSFTDWIRRLLDEKIGWPDAVPYNGEDRSMFAVQFDGIENIKKNYSKHLQDMWVLACLNGKRNGTYLEIGAGNPFVHNNTALLETEFDWKGISIEWSAHLAYDFAQRRTNTIINANALDIDFEDLLVKHCMENTIDFLQIDTDETSIQVLRNIPFHRYKFNVVQFEHDAYRLGDDIRAEARQIMKNNGYEIVCQNLSFQPNAEYEDWFVHRSIIDNIPHELFKSDERNFFWDYLMWRKGD